MILKIFNFPHPLLFISSRRAEFPPGVIFLQPEKLLAYFPVHRSAGYEFLQLRVI